MNTIDTTALEEDALAYLLWKPRALADLDLTPQDFASPRHQRILAAIADLALNDGQEKIDVSLLHAELVRQGVEVTFAQLADLHDRDVAGIDGIVRELRRAARRRRYHLAAQALIAALEDPRTDEGEAIETHIAGLLAGDDDRARLVDLAAAVRWAAAEPAGGAALTVGSGLPSFDQVFGGFARGTLTVVAGRTRRGKSAFLQQVSETVGCSGRVLLASAELSARDLATRSLARGLGIDLARLRLGRLTATERTRRERYASPATLQVRVFEGAGQTIKAITKQARAVALGGGLDLLAVDYLQYLPEPRRRDETRASQLGRMTCALRDLGVALNAAVLVAAQLNRRVDEREDEPRLSDLRESGEIEQDADMVIFLHPRREEGQIKLIVAKHRNGEEGYVDLGWEPAFMRFSDPRPAAAAQGAIL